MTEQEQVLRELSVVEERCREFAAAFRRPDVSQKFSALIREANRVGESSSGSWLGYHARVYLEDFQPKSPSYHFDSEWGDDDRFSATTCGPWREYARNEVVNHILESAGVGSLDEFKTLTQPARGVFDYAHGELLPLLDALIEVSPDHALKERRAKIAELKPYTPASRCVQPLRPESVLTRDMRALQGGLATPPHIEVIGAVQEILSHMRALSALAEHASYLVKYLQRKSQMRSMLSAAAPPVAASAQASRKSESAGAPVDIALITVIPEEWAAIRRLVSSPQLPKLGPGRPNKYSWELGTIETSRFSRPYRVVTAMAGRAGNGTGLLATLDTLREWQPRYALLVGIAGGISANGVALGDVVLSAEIWGYEYGKVEQSGFAPRHDLTFHVDGPLLNAATSLAARDDDWLALHSERNEDRVPTVHWGPVASGEKVMDYISSEAFAPVLKAWPKLAAIEMEGLGAAQAVKSIQDGGGVAGLLMIRGISDVPRSDKDPPPEDGAQGEERKAWKKRASSAAAAFAVSLIQRGWPVQPLDEDS